MKMILESLEKKRDLAYENYLVAERSVADAESELAKVRTLFIEAKLEVVGFNKALEEIKSAEEEGEDLDKI